MNEAVLEFDQVAVQGGHLYDCALWQVNLRLMPGELALVHLEQGRARIPLADAAQGLIEPAQGRVCFLGRDWSTLKAKAKLAARAKIGRVFDEPAWLTELDVEENITLAQRHHTRRAVSTIRYEASQLARRFSLPGLPQGRPSSMRPADLRRAACVRALLGRPELLILERPSAGVYPAIMLALMTAVSSARARGAAVLWTTEDWEVWNDSGINPTMRFKMTGSQMSLLTGE